MVYRLRALSINENRIRGEGSRQWVAKRDIKRICRHPQRVPPHFNALHVRADFAGVIQDCEKENVCWNEGNNRATGRREQVSRRKIRSKCEIFSDSKQKVMYL